MDYIKYRKHPRVYKKKEIEEKETIVNIGAVTAAGILAAVFVKGLLLGYIITKKLS